MYTTLGEPSGAVAAINGSGVESAAVRPIFPAKLSLAGWSWAVRLVPQSNPKATSERNFLATFPFSLSGNVISTSICMRNLVYGKRFSKLNCPLIVFNTIALVDSTQILEPPHLIIYV